MPSRSRERRPLRELRAVVARTQKHDDEQKQCGQRGGHEPGSEQRGDRHARHRPDNDEHETRRDRLRHRSPTIASSAIEYRSASVPLPLHIRERAPVRHRGHVGRSSNRRCRRRDTSPNDENDREAAAKMPNQTRERVRPSRRRDTRAAFHQQAQKNEQRHRPASIDVRDAFISCARPRVLSGTVVVIAR